MHLLDVLTTGLRPPFVSPILKTMIPPELAATLASNPEILGGTVCFQGTRVPVETLLDYLQDGISLDRFLRGYPTVGREQALAVVRWQVDQARRQVVPAPGP